MRVLMICNTDGALYVFRKPIIEALLARGNEVRAISGRSEYFDRLERLGVQPLALDFSRHSASPFKNLSLLSSLFRLIKANGPDVVHSFTHKPAIFGTVAARLAGCRRVFVTITGLGTLFVRDDFRSRLLRSLLLLQYRFALVFARRVFFQNPDDLEYFLSRRIVAARKAVLTHGSGLDLRDYPLPSEAAIEESRAMLAAELGMNLSGKRVVLFPARAVSEKGFREYYGAAEAINATCSGRYVFLHFGLIDTESSRGISKQDLEGLARRSGVAYLGFKDNISQYMLGADIVALPSYREGVPRSLIEALAFGKAIVATDAPGCRETVVDGWNGRLCKVADVASLVSALLAIDDEALRQARIRSRELAESKFDSSILVGLTLGAYSDC